MTSAGDGTEGAGRRPESAHQHASPDDDVASVPRTRQLCLALLRATGLDGAAVAMLADTGERDLVDATDPVVAHLDELQFTLAEGPCLEAYARRDRVSVPDLASPEAQQRFPVFAQEAERAGAGAVFAWPMTTGEVSFGVLELYRRTPGELDRAALAHVETAVEALSQVALGELLSDDAAAEHAASWPGRLSVPHAQVHQAAGMVAVHLDVSLPDALARMRASAYSTDLTLVELARQVLSGTTRVEKDYPS